MIQSCLPPLSRESLALLGEDSSHDWPAAGGSHAQHFGSSPLPSSAAPLLGAAAGGRAAPAAVGSEQAGGLGRTLGVGAARASGAHRGNAGDGAASSGGAGAATGAV